MNSVLTRLFRFIETSYSLDDIRTLCLDLDVDYDNLGGETKKAKIRELLLQLGREKRFAELLVRLNETRQKAFPETGLSTDTKTLKALYEALPDFETITTQYQQSPLGDSSSVTVSNSEIKGGYIAGRDIINPLPSPEEEAIKAAQPWITINKSALVIIGLGYAWGLLRSAFDQSLETLLLFGCFCFPIFLPLGLVGYIKGRELKHQQLRRLSLATLGGAGLFVITLGIIAALVMVYGIGRRALGP